MPRCFGLFSCLILTFLVHVVICGEVVVLTDSTFEHLTQASTGQTTGKWFVKFYAPWCGHCKNLAPTWDELGSVDELDNEGIVIAKVDSTDNPQVTKRFGVRGYPTLKYIANGSVYTYKGPRTLEALQEYVLGGYKSTEGAAVPAPPSWITEQRKKFSKMFNENRTLRMLMEDFQHIVDMRKNAAVVLVLIGAFLGVVMGLVMGKLGGGKTKKKEE